MKIDTHNNSFQFTFGNYTSTVYITREYNLSSLLAAPPGSKVLPVFDKQTAALFYKGQDLPAVIIPSGEEHKSWESINAILEKAVAENLARDSFLCGVGGGIVCDLVAFAASIYMRGCQLKLVPTTFLAMVDASLGGKTGMNFMGFKNLVGSFYPALEIHMCLPVLNALPETEYRNGLAEVIKTAMLGDKALFALLLTEKDGIQKRDSDILEEIVRRSIIVKGKIVEGDLTEKGQRALLNLGHTFAHALESAAQFVNWNHGQAVAWGLAQALDLGQALGITAPDYASQVKKLIADYGFRTTVDNIDAEQIVTAMTKDKKKLKGKVRFIVQKNLCETEIIEADREIVKKIIH